MEDQAPATGPTRTITGPGSGTPGVRILTQSQLVPSAQAYQRLGTPSPRAARPRHPTGSATLVDAGDRPAARSSLADRPPRLPAPGRGVRRVRRPRRRDRRPPRRDPGRHLRARTGPASTASSATCGGGRRQARLRPDVAILVRDVGSAAAPARLHPARPPHAHPAGPRDRRERPAVPADRAGRLRQPHRRRTACAPSWSAPAPCCTRSRDRSTDAGRPRRRRSGRPCAAPWPPSPARRVRAHGFRSTGSRRRSGSGSTPR